MTQQLLIAPTGRWEGNDGLYSTFSMDVGAPPQTYRVLPWVSGSELWVPSLPAACSSLAVDINACQVSRGSYGGAPMLESSDSWTNKDIWALSSESYLFNDNPNGTYGLDVVELKTTTGGIFQSNVSNQLIAGYVTPDVWIGIFGLAVGSSALGGQSYPSLLDHLKSVGRITSRSFGYTAGRWYRSTLGSLSIGGYDTNIISTGGLTISINGSNPELRLNLQRLTVTNSSGSWSIAPQSNSTFKIDSATSQLWLPAELCDYVQAAFGLDYDDKSNYYLISSSINEGLLKKSVSIAVALGESKSAGITATITLKYEALAANISAIPYNESSRLYFPMRKAADETQYVLGRVLLQEAYLAVDWETLNFTIGQAPAPTQQGVIETSPGVGSGSPDSGLSTDGATSKAVIGGVVAAIVVLLSAVTLLGYWFWRRRLRQREEIETSQAPEVPMSPKYTEAEMLEKLEKLRRATVGSQDVPEGDGTLPLYEPPPAPPVEMPAPHGEAMLMSNEILEMEGDCVPGELRSAEDIRRSSEVIKQKTASVTVEEVS